MGIEEYFKEYNEKVDRLTTLCHDAVRLGQDERAKELLDEFYEFAFRHYRIVCGQVKFLEDLTRKYPEMENFLDEFRSFAEQHAQSLDKLASVIVSLST